MIISIVEDMECVEQANAFVIRDLKGCFAM